VGRERLTASAGGAAQAHEFLVVPLWHHGCSTFESSRSEPGGSMDENEHPKGALLFMLIYLFLLAVLWTNAYLKLWRG